MLVYVINLDRARDRLAHMNSQFERLGTSFTRIAAVDAKVMAGSDLQRFITGASRRHEWSPAQVAIFLSHKRAWRELAATCESHAAIFEDDVHLSDGVAPILRSSDWIDESMHIVRLETTLQSMKLDPSPIARFSGRNIFRVRSEAWGAAGYIIRRDIAARLVCRPSDVYEPVDWMLFHPKSALASEIEVFQVDPAPCVQDQYNPNITKRLKFSMETTLSADLKNELARSTKQFFSPLVRRLMRRRAVPFA